MVHGLWTVLLWSIDYGLWTVLLWSIDYGLWTAFRRGGGERRLRQAPGNGRGQSGRAWSVLLGIGTAPADQHRLAIFRRAVDQLALPPQRRLLRRLPRGAGGAAERRVG